MEIFGMNLTPDFVRDLVLVLAGSIIAWVTQLVFFLLEGLRDTRNKKKQLYSEYLICIRHGFRIYHDLFRLQRDTSELMADLKRMKSKASKNQSKSANVLIKRNISQRERESERLVSRTQKLDASLDIYLERTDEVISGLYLVAPEYVTEIAVLIRKAFDILIDDFEDLQAMENTFTDFAKFLKSDARGVLFGVFHILIHNKKFRNWNITKKVKNFKMD